MAKYGPEQFKIKNGNIVTIRHCKPEDAIYFEAYQQQLAKESTHTLQRIGHCPPVEKVKENWKFCEEQESHLKLGVFNQEKFIAQLMFFSTRADHPWTKHIAGFGMGVLKNYWNQGIGYRLLEIMEEHAIKNHIQRIEALVRVNNEQGIALYKKFGFEIEGRKKRAAIINGEFQDEYYIAKLV